MTLLQYQFDNLFFHAFNDAPIGMSIVGLDGQLLKVNQALCKITGYSEDELLQTTFQTITYPEHVLESLDLKERLIKGDIHTYQLEKKFYHKSGKEIWTLLNVSMVRDNEGVPLYFISQIQDVSDRKMEQQQLKKAEELYHLISNHAQDLITVATPDGITHFASPSIYKLIGYTPDEVVGKTNWELYHPDDIKALSGVTFKDEDSFICRVRHKNGIYIWFETTIKMIRNEIGEVEKVLGIGRDITARKQAEEELKSTEQMLRESESEYRLISENSLDMISKFSLDGTYSFVSPASKVLLGYDPKEMIGYSNYDFVHPDDIEEIKRLNSQLLERKELYSVIYRMRRKDGSYIWYESSRKVIHHPVTGEAKEILSFSRDISERIQFERSLQESEQRYKSLFEYNPAAVFSFDLTGNYMSFNENLEKLVGYPKDKLLSTNFTRFVEHQDLEKTLYHFELAKQGIPQSYEITVVNLHGQRIKTSITNVPIKINHEIVGVYGIAYDITEQRLAEEMLIESELKYRLITENSLDMISEFSLDGTYTFVSPASKVLLGYEPTEMIGRSNYHFVHPDDVEEIKRLNTQLLHRKELYSVIYRMRRKDGSYIWYESSRKIIEDPRTAEAKEILSFSRDITERKKNADRIDQLNYQNKLILDSVAEGIYGINLNGTIIFCNSSATDMLGYSKRDLENNKESLFWHSNLKKGTSYSKGTKDTIYWGEEFYRKDGTSFPVELTRTPLYDKGCIVGFVVNFSDISERIHIEQIKEEKRQMELELSLASSVQQSLLTNIDSLHLPDSIEVGVISVPFRSLNGDFYNFTRSEQELLFAIADIPGKGIPAAIFMAMMKFMMDEVLQNSHLPNHVLALLNRFVDKYSDISTFVTMFIGSYNEQTSRLYFSNAGHEPAILYRNRSGETIDLITEGPVLGLSKTSTFLTNVIELESGDMILLYTDGVIEDRMSDKMDDNQAIKLLLKEVNKNQSAQEIVEFLYEKIREKHGGKVWDDQTILLLRKVSSRL